MFRHIRAVWETVATVVVVIAAGALIWRLYQSPPPRPAGAGSPIEAVSDLSISSSFVTNVRGDGRAVLVEFADFECPFCARHAQQTAPVIKKELLDSGEIQHVFLNFPLPIHPRAQKASEAAECAAQQGRFWEMREQLFANQRSLEISDLSMRAEGLGLDRPRFIKCLENGETAEKVRADEAEGRRLGVKATPTFFVGFRESDGSITLVKRINGAAPFDTFNEIIRDVASTERAQR